MRRFATHIILAFLAMIAMSSCTHNNGDIGYLFGLWHLDTIEIDGEPDAAYDGCYYFMFQSHVFCVRHVYDDSHSSVESFAEWQESDDGSQLIINFKDSRFSPMVDDDQCHLMTVTTFRIITINATNMVLSYTNPITGKTYTYYLTQWK